MAEFNDRQRELSLKIVYCGPSSSGKTTNLEALSQMAPREACGRLVRLAARAGWTTLCDRLLLCCNLRTKDEHPLRVKLKIFSAPGQPCFHFTRRALLKDADAVVFVADAQKAESAANKRSFADLKELLQSGDVPSDLPLVIQYNKNDLTDGSLTDTIKNNHQIYRAVAFQGRGVRETLEGLLRICWPRIRQKCASTLDESSFIKQFFAGFHPQNEPG